MNDVEKQKLINELKNFSRQLVNYKYGQSRGQFDSLTEQQERSLDKLRFKLQREHGRLSKAIRQYAGDKYLLLYSMRHEAFSYGLSSLRLPPRGLEALDLAIGLVNKAIGGLEAVTLGESKSSDVRPAKATTRQPSTTTEGDPRRIFVVHGRNEKAREAMFVFLRSIGLEPIEWLEAVKLTGKASPYVGEILDKVFSYAKAVVVFLTGDDLARLGTRFTEEGEPDEELKAQARPNVIFEAGLAFGRNPDRTILVQFGELRDISDVAGRHVIRMDNTVEKRQGLASRLKTAGCDVQIETRTDWHNVGDFDGAVVSPDK